MANRPLLLWTLATSFACVAGSTVVYAVRVTIPAGSDLKPFVRIGLSIVYGLILGAAQAACLRGIAAEVDRKLWFWFTGAAWTAGSILWFAVGALLSPLLDSRAMVFGSAAAVSAKWILLGALQARLLPRNRSTWIGIMVIGGLLSHAASVAFQSMASSQLMSPGMKEGGSLLLRGAAAGLEGLVLGWLTAAALLRPSLKDALLSYRTSLVAALITVYSGLAVLSTPVRGLRPMLGMGPPPPPGAWVVFGAGSLALLASTWGRPRAWNLAARTMGLFALGSGVLAGLEFSESMGGWTSQSPPLFLLAVGHERGLRDRLAAVEPSPRFRASRALSVARDRSRRSRFKAAASFRCMTPVRTTHRATTAPARPVATQRPITPLPNVRGSMPRPNWVRTTPTATPNATSPRGDREDQPLPELGLRIVGEEAHPPVRLPTGSSFPQDWRVLPAVVILNGP